MHFGFNYAAHRSIDPCSELRAHFRAPMARFVRVPEVRAVPAAFPPDIFGIVRIFHNTLLRCFDLAVIIKPVALPTDDTGQFNVTAQDE